MTLRADAAAPLRPDRAGEASHRGAVGLFLGLTFGFSAVFYALIIASGHLTAGGGRYVSGLMWCPGFAALLTCRLRGIDLATLGWRWAGFRYQWASYALPAAYSLVAYAAVWAFHLGGFPSPAFLRDSAAAVGIDAIPPWAAAIAMVLLNAVYGFIRACANALGEESAGGAFSRRGWSPREASPPPAS